MRKKVTAAVDEIAMRELELFADNENKLYPAKLNIIKRAQKMLKTGSYDAAKIQQFWLAWFKLAAEKYVKDFGSKNDAWFNMFNLETLQALAKGHEEFYKEEIELGAYDILPDAEKEVKSDLEEVVTEEFEGQEITASVSDYALNGQKLYSFTINGKESPLKAASAEAAISLAKMMVKASVEPTTEAVLAELLLTFKLEENSELGVELAGSLDYEDGNDKGTFEYDGTTYEFILSEEKAIALAQEDVAEMWESDPGTHSDFLNNYFYMTETDIRIVAGEEADSYVENMSSRELIESEGFQETFDAAEEADEDTDAIVKKAKESALDSKYEEVKKALENDPVGYFKEMGMDIEAIKKMPVISVDYEKAAEDAVALDGWEHTLSRYDGDYETTPNGMVYFQEA